MVVDVQLLLYSIYTGQAHYKLHKNVLDKSPNKFIKNPELKRLQKNKIPIKPKRKLFKTVDKDYGTDCQKPDLSPEDQYSEAKN